LSLLALALVSMFFPLAGLVLAGEIVFYLSIMILAGVYLAVRQRKPYLIFGLPLAISAMHVTWGSGLLWSILSSSSRKNG
jgi:hypothetical protein